MSKVKSYAALSEKTPLEPYNIIRRECNSDDVLIKIEYCGVCHSDILEVKTHLLEGIQWKT